MEHAKRCGEIRNVDKVLEENPEGKGPLRTSSYSLCDNINVELR